MIGTLNETVTLLARQEAPDGGGGAALSWTETDSVPAQAESLRSGRERAATRQTRLYRRRFTIRERDDVGHDTRLVHDGRTFRLLSIRRQGEGPAFLILDGEEIS